jgi:hypothetical protein
MAIKISGTTVIDDSRNLVSVGVATVGSGNSAVILNGITGSLNVGSGVTINGNTGDINISGILTVGQLSVPISVISFSPANGSTTATAAGNVVITFNQTVGVGTTGFIEVFVGTARSEFISVGSTRAFMTNGGTKLNIDPTNNFPGLSTVRIVMSSEFITANGRNFTGINTSTSVGVGTTYTFNVTPALGSAYLGGRFICQSGGINWILAPVSTEVSRTWTAINDAVTTANASAACGDWFVPNAGQLQNPGYVCRTYWDVISGTFSRSYWSSTEAGPQACGVQMGPTHGGRFIGPKTLSFCVRSFRCVTY